MKKLLPLSTLLTLTTAPLPAEPALHLSTSTLTPTTTLKLSFETAMVADDQVGTTGPNEMLKIEPPLAGDLKWIEPNVALFERKGIPALATSYQFSMPSGFKHLDGTVIPETSLQTVRTAPFHYQTGYWRGNTRQPDYFLRFNDAIDPAAVTGKLHFVDKKGNTVAATVRQGIYRDVKNSRALGPTWEQSFQSWKAPDITNLDPGTQIPVAITVSPIHPLPVGESWKLVLERGITNKSTGASTVKAIERWIGSVTKFEIASIQAVTRVDAKPYISIGLSKKLPEDLKVSDLARFIQIDPIPANMKLEAGRSLISIKGDFPNRSKWKVTIKHGMTAFDGLAMLESKSEAIRFRHLTPVLAAPSYAAAQ
ncbi:MAG: hypothetical protein VYA27_09555, partial [Verrucomicrobiota bacterium]|nr:hypothetical protein [Verrucomicrobiota bacterium]